MRRDDRPAVVEHLSAAPGTVPGRREGAGSRPGRRRRGSPPAGARQPLHDVVDLPEELTSIRRPAVRIAARGLGDEPVDLGRDVGHQLRRRRDGLVDVLVGHRQRAVASVRLGPGKQLEQDDACGIDIRTGVPAGAPDLFRGQVGHGPDDHPGPRLGTDAERPGQAEVHDLQVAVRRYEHVLRLDVPVHDPGRVRGGQPGQQRHHDGQRLARGEPATLVEQVPQGPARQILHGQVQVRPVAALVVDGDHVRMREPRHGLGLADEPVDEILVPRQVRVHDLERHPPVEASVHGAVHRGHAAHRNQRLHLVAAVQQPSDQRICEGSVHRAQLYEQVNHTGLDYSLCGPPVAGGDEALA